MIIFKDDWDKYPNAIVDTKTTNDSFINYSLLLKKMKIENHHFPLALLNPDLQGIDPHSPTLTLEQMLAVGIECKNNFWYFIREVIRIPQQGSESVPFIANRANMSVFWLYLNHITALILMPRQCGKSILLDTVSTYLLNISLKNSKLILLTKDDFLRSANLERLKDMMTELPPYLRQLSKKDISNTEEIQIKSLGNNIIGLLPSKSQKQALNLGRGHTSANILIDEIAFLYNIKISLPALLAATTTARDISEANGTSYGTIISTTAGKKDDKDGKFAYDLYNNSTVWTETILDLKKSELKTVISRNNSRGIERVNCSFNHRQIGKTDEWVIRAMTESESKGQDAERDYLCRWTSGSTSTPIDKNLAAKIRESESEPIYNQLLAGYSLRWYIEESQIKGYLSEPTIMSLDTSDASGGDEISLIIMSVKTGATLAVGNYNETNLIEFSRYLFDHLIKPNPKLITIIERKSSGPTIIDYLLLYLFESGINPFARLFNTTVNNYEENNEHYKEIERGRISYDHIVKFKKSFGFNTSGGGLASRSDLYGETLQNATKNVGIKIYDKRIIDQLLFLEIRNGRVDHPLGEHDDMVIGWLLAYFFLSKAKNHNYYGINSGEALSMIKHGSELTKEDHRSMELKNKVNKLYNDLVIETDQFVIFKLENELKRVMNDLTLVSDDALITYDALKTRLENDRKLYRQTY